MLWSIFLLAQQPVLGATIFAQTFTPNNLINADADQPAFTADDFSFGTPQTIRSITWWGSYFPNIGSEGLDAHPDAGTPPASLDFSVNFFTSPIGGESSLIANFDLGDAVEIAPTGVTYIEPIRFFEFSANLTHDLVLPPGTFWISIYSNKQYDANMFRWAISYNAGNTWSSIGIDNPYYFNGTTGHATYFVLDNEYISNVPIPAGVWLFLSALLGLMGFRKVKI